MPDGERQIDLTLIQAVGGGDRVAFATLVNRHGPAVLAMLRHLTHDATAADDAFQDAMVAAWRHAAAFRGDASARTWLMTLARHAAFRQRRLRAGEPRVHEDLATLGVSAGWGDTDFDPEHAASLVEDKARLAAAMAGLSDDDREIIVLRDLHDISGDACAEMLGLTLAAMKTRLHRARLRLVAALRTSTIGIATSGGPDASR